LTAEEKQAAIDTYSVDHDAHIGNDVERAVVTCMPLLMTNGLSKIVAESKTLTDNDLHKRNLLVFFFVSDKRDKIHHAFLRRTDATFTLHKSVLNFAASLGARSSISQKIYPRGEGLFTIDHEEGIDVSKLLKKKLTKTDSEEFFDSTNVGAPTQILDQDVDKWRVAARNFLVAYGGKVRTHSCDATHSRTLRHIHVQSSSNSTEAMCTDRCRLRIRWSWRL
jgi:hypothetical protein